MLTSPDVMFCHFLSRTPSCIENKEDDGPETLKPLQFFFKGRHSFFTICKKPKKHN